MLSKKQFFFLRLLTTRVLLLAIFGLLISRLWYLQVVEGARFHQQAELNQQRTLPTLPLRGRILDRNGVVLAENVPSFSVLAMVEDLPEEQASLRAMLDRLCALVQCSGTLEVDPDALSFGAREKLLPWLPGPMGVPEAEVAEILDEMGNPFTLTVALEETDAGWLRSVVSTTAGLTYNNVLEEALESNTLPPYLPVPLMENVPRECALILEENRLDLPGILVQAEPLRRYPTGVMTAHIVGYDGRVSPEDLELFNPDPGSREPLRYLENDRIGKVGAERAYEDLLRGQLGFREIQVDASGHAVGAPLQLVPPQAGNDVVLTLDTDLQEKTTEILQYYIDRAERDRRSYYRPVYSGAAVVMDLRNGQILAMVSLPTYDNNLFVQGISAAEFRALLEDSHHPLVNRAISGDFPPGSTFKIMIAAAGLQEGVITPETLIWDRGAVVVPNRYDPSLPPQLFPCWARGGHGRLNVVRGIQYSCNVFFFTVTGGTPENKFEDGLGIERLAHWAHAFGFGVPSGLDFPGESSGLIPTPEWKESTLGEPWFQGDLYNMGIGQGNVLVTPVQLVNMAAIIANGGTRYRPQLLLKVLDGQGRTVQPFTPHVEQALEIAPENLAAIREGMRRVVAEGSFDYARKTSPVTIAGKTGSAEFGPYLRPGDRQSHAWFVGYAPYEDPQLAVVVVIEGGGHGSLVSEPAVADIITYYFTRPKPGQPNTPP